ncbi:MAG: hypothetical protein JNM19_03225 [Chitinophagaceae bacterium]|nr:hypothetical protein [Chitinophagaceae bacterium]
MRIIFSFLVALLFLACNNPASNKVSSVDTLKNVKQIHEIPITEDTIFQAFSGEPIWSVFVIRDKEIVFMPGDDAKLVFPFVKPTTVSEEIMKYSSVTCNSAIEMTVISAPCSDGMSEMTHPYLVELKVNKREFTGCGTDE